jgi:hypothetical protein
MADLATWLVVAMREEWRKRHRFHGLPDIPDEDAKGCVRAILAALRAEWQPLWDNVAGPHEWGYRDVTDGTFIEDDAPFRLIRLIEGALE